MSAPKATATTPTSSHDFRPAPYLWRMAKPYWPWLLAALIFQMAAAIFLMQMNYALRKLVDGVAKFQGDPDAIFQAVSTSFALFVALHVGTTISFQISAITRTHAMPLIRTGIRAGLFAHLLQHSYRFFQENHAGKVGTKVSEAARSGIRVLATLIRNISAKLAAITTGAILLYHVHPLLAVALGVWFVLYMVIVFTVGQKTKKLAFAASDAASTSTGKIIDAVNNSGNVRTFNGTDFEEDYLEVYRWRELGHARRHLRMSYIFNFLQGTTNVLLGICIVYGTLKLWATGSVTPGTLAMIITLSIAVMNHGFELAEVLLELFDEWGNYTEGLALVTAEHEVVDSPNAAVLNAPKTDITFQNVTFAYPGQKDAVFKNLNLTITAGQRVGLVGFSGAGKTTFVHLLMRLFDLPKGKILIGGKDISKVTQESLRAHIGLIPQDPSLFHRNLMENIRYGRPSATDDEVIEASKQAHAHDFITHMPKGYQTVAGERGIKLSGGQRQRIAIARAALKNAPILVLDEATSALDSVTEKKIQESLSTLMTGKTVIVVAHRLSTIAHLDRILVFDKGTVVEDGSHEELLAKNGAYAKLWHMQAGGFLVEDDDTVLEEATS